MVGSVMVRILEIQIITTFTMWGGGRADFWEFVQPQPMGDWMETLEWGEVGFRLEEVVEILQSELTARVTWAHSIKTWLNGHRADFSEIKPGAEFWKGGSGCTRLCPCLEVRCVAVCCSVLQWVAVGCSGLQWVAVGCSGLQRIAVSCSGLQY